MIKGLWKEKLEVVLKRSWYQELQDFIEGEYQHKTIYPPRNQIYNALNLTPYESVRVVILGQDPYHGRGQAMGLSFSVNDGIALPKSLANIYRELYDDLKITRLNGDLSSWAKQGVLLLNTLLSVEEGKPLSHQGKGWEMFTDAVIEAVNQKEKPVIFVLWGKHAQAKKSMIDNRHKIIMGPHPSPLSAYRGFFGSKPFSQINNYLREMDEPMIDWS